MRWPWQREEADKQGGFTLRFVRHEGTPLPGGSVVIVPRDSPNKMLGVTDRKGEARFESDPGFCKVYFKDAEVYQGVLFKAGPVREITMG